MQVIKVTGSGLFSGLNIQAESLAAGCRNIILESVHKQIVMVWAGRCKDAPHEAATFVRFMIDSEKRDLERIAVLPLPVKEKELLAKERRDNQCYFNRWALEKARVPLELCQNPFVVADLNNPEQMLAYWLKDINFDYVDGLWADYGWTTYCLCGHCEDHRAERGRKRLADGTPVLTRYNGIHVSWNEFLGLIP